MSCKASFDQISQWVDPKCFFSKSKGWDNIAIVGMLGDYALNFTSGDMLEIGVGESSVYMTALAKKYNRRIYYCDNNSDKIADIKDAGYFSDNGKIFSCASDEMFEQDNLTPLAFSFIDGYHGYEESKRDFWNAEKLTVTNGHILMHDSYPHLESWQGKGGCGEVWKLRQEIEKDKRFDVFTFVGDTHLPYAVTLIRKKPINRPYYQE